MTWGLQAMEQMTGAPIEQNLVLFVSFDGYWSAALEQPWQRSCITSCSLIHLPAWRLRCAQVRVPNHLLYSIPCVKSDEQSFCCCFAKLLLAAETQSWAVTYLSVTSFAPSKWDLGGLQDLLPSVPWCKGREWAYITVECGHRRMLYTCWLLKRRKRRAKNN